MSSESKRVRMRTLKSMTVFNLPSQEPITLYWAPIFIYQYYIRTLLSVRWQEGEKKAVDREYGFGPGSVCALVG